MKYCKRKSYVHIAKIKKCVDIVQHNVTLCLGCSKGPSWWRFYIGIGHT